MTTTRAQRAFAKEVFERFPSFDPEKSLYLDFEGTGTQESALNLYWPVAPERDRFQLLLPRRGKTSLDPVCLEQALRRWKLTPRAVRHVVVFSGSAEVGGTLTQNMLKEEERLWNWAGREVFPKADWVSLWVVLRRCGPMKESIRKGQWVRSTKRSGADYSQEALEWEFGLQRPERIRSHSKVYRHPRPGSTGSFSPLSAINAAQLEGDRTAAHLLKEYCRWDVEALYTISSSCRSLVRR